MKWNEILHEPNTKGQNDLGGKLQLIVTQDLRNKNSGYTRVLSTIMIGSRNREDIRAEDEYKGGELKPLA